jgi:hypothetical protein
MSKACFGCGIIEPDGTIEEHVPDMARDASPNTWYVITAGDNTERLYCPAHLEGSPEV